MKCSGIAVDQISILDKDEQTYLVESQTEKGVRYFVDMSIGICSCMGGQDGSPCSHQAAIMGCLVLIAFQNYRHQLAKKLQ